jgi:hypothetical protein
MKKLNLKGIVDLVEYAVAEGYFSPDYFRALDERPGDFARRGGNSG